MRRVLAVALIVLPGCASDLRLERDTRLRFVRPPDRAEVTPPLVLEWRMRDFATRRSGERDGSLFAVFVDRAPMRPGEDLDALADDVDPACARAAGCPDRRWLERHGVLVSERPRVLVRVLDRDRGRPAADGRRRHELTVVLLDPRGVRSGESAWRRTIYVADDR